MAFNTTRQVAKVLDVKSHAVTRHAKKFELLPAQDFDGKPMWTDEEAGAFCAHYKEVRDGVRCPTCGTLKPNAPAETLCEDEHREPGDE